MDIESIRKNTPGLEHVVHFNSAGTSLVSRNVLNAQLNYLNEEARRGGFETAALFHEQLEELYFNTTDEMDRLVRDIAEILK